MKNNIEIIISLLITFLIYITLVFFYESKIPNYYDNTKNFKVEVEVTDINNDIITLNNVHYLETKEKLELNKKYYITLKPNEKLIEKDNLTKLMQTYEIVKIEYKKSNI